MKRKKRNYIFSILAGFLLLFSTAFLYISIERAVSYKKAPGRIISVDTQQREGGTSGDRYYYTESNVKCEYIAGGHEYIKIFEIKGDYSGRKGEKVTILYNEEDPLDCTIDSNNTVALVSSVCYTIFGIFAVIIDIMQWCKFRKEENKTLSQEHFSDADMEQYSAQIRKQKKINIVLIIASVLCLVLFMFDIPLIVITIARIADHRSCSTLELKNTEE